MATVKELIIPKVWLRPDVLLPSLGINVLGLALPIVILQVYDRVLTNAALDTFAIMLIGLCGVVVLEVVLRIGRSFVMSWLGARFEHQAGTVAFNRLLDADLTQFESHAPGSHLDRLQGMDTLRDFYAGQAATLSIDLPFVVIFLGLIWFIAGNLVLIPITLLLVFSLTALLLGRRLRTAMRERSTLDDRRYNFMIEALGGIHTIKAMAMEPLMLRRYERLQAQSAYGIEQLSRLTSIGHGLGNTFSQIAMIAVVAVGAVYAVQGQLSIGALAAITMLTGRSLQPVLRAMALWTQFQGIRLARERMEEIFALPPESVAERPLRPSLSGAISVESVSFRYGTSGPMLLDGVSLDIEPGETIGLTGNNGVGKSTLIHLMMGLIKPIRGRILVDGRDVSQIDPVTLRSQVAFMPQTAALFQGTLLDNLTMFRDGEAIERAIDIARALGLDDVIVRLPNGLNTRIGDGTVEALPNGVRQRIAMARALVGDPPIILFDDANGTLDQRSDDLLRDLLLRFKGNRTMVVISHRPSFLSLCDRCYRIAGGELQPMEVPTSGGLAAQPSLPQPQPAALSMHGAN